MSTTLDRNKPALEADAVGALGKVQKAFRRIIKALPGPFERPSEIQHCLGIDPKVAWHFFKLAKAEDPLAAAPHVPGRLLMRRIGQAALRKGVPTDVIESAQTAIEEFEKVVKNHAATRTAFKAIVATMSGDESAEGLALQQRHTAFNMLSQLWGERVDLHYSQAIFRREDPHTTTTGVATFKSGLQHLRPDASSMLEGYLGFDAPGSKIQALEPDAAEKYGSSLLPAFCSQPVPQFTIEQRNDGWRYSIVQNKNIGRRGAVDLAFGRRVEGDAINRLRDGTEIVIHGTRSVTPTAAAVLDLLVHRPSFPTADPQFAIFGDQTLTTMENLVDYGRRLPSVGTLQSLGNAALATTSPHDTFPRYDEFQHHVFAKLGYDRAEFDVFRLQMSYPILHTLTAIWFNA